MFGIKSNQATVGPATVQNPSMLDNVSTGDFKPGSGAAVTEVEKQVKEALAAHDRTEVAKTVTDDPSVGAAQSGAFISSDSAAPTAVTASNASEPAQTAPPAIQSVAAPVADDQTPHDSDTPAPTDAVAEEATPDVAAEVEEAAIPQPLTSATPDEPVKTDLASTVPGIQVHEASSGVELAPVTADEPAPQPSGSAPVAPPAPPANFVEPAVEPPTEEAAEIADDSAVDSSVDQSPEPNPEPQPDTEQQPEGQEVSGDADAESFVGAEEQISATEEPQPQSESEPAQQDDTVTPAVAAAAVSSVPAVDPQKLADLKQHALDHLEPLADTLDQSPQEEFRTTMMRIRANDNHTLLDKALEAAKTIPDDKQRAQALLDIVNEVNYFSQPPSE